MKEYIDREWVAKAIKDEGGYTSQIMKQIYSVFATPERWRSREVSLRLHDDGRPYLLLVPKKTNPQ